MADKRAVIRRHMRRRRTLLAYALVLPALMIIVPLFGYPIIYAVVRSLEVRRTLGVEYGLGNYVTVLTDPTVWNAVGNSLIITISSVSIQLALAFALALMMKEQTRRWRGVRGLFILTWPLPTFVAAFAWTWLLDHDLGLVNELMAAIGLDRVPFLSEPIPALISVIIADVWKHLPWTLIVMIAAVTMVDEALLEAIQIDGGGYLRQVRHVVLPAIIGLLPAIIVLRSVWTFNVFDLIFLMTGGGPGERTMIVPVLIYKYAFQNNDFGGASALGMVVLIILSPLIWLIMGRLEKEARQ